MKISTLFPLKRLCTQFLCSAFALVLSNTAWNQTYFPPLSGSQWDTISPNSLAWCEDSILSLYDMLDQEGTDAFLILKDGKIVLEKYYGFYNMNSTQAWNSASKSLMAFLVGIAQDDGLINIQNKTSDYLGTGWTNIPSNKEDLITVWHQLTMTSGLDEGNFFCTSPWCLNYVADAGARWAYHNGPYLLLQDLVTSQTGGTFNGYTDSLLEQYIGMNGQWQTLLGNTTYHASARDMARFGWLVVNNGIWDGFSVLGDQSYINAMRTPSQNLNPSYGYLWWLNGQSSYVNTSPTVTVPGMVSPSAPSDVYCAAGANGQFISICPSLGLIMIRQGNGSGNYTEFELHDRIWAKIMGLYCTTASMDETTFSSNKKRIKIVDLLGRETEFKPNTPLIYIYDDGSTERVMELEE